MCVSIVSLRVVGIRGTRDRRKIMHPLISIAFKTRGLIQPYSKFGVCRDLYTSRLFVRYDTCYAKRLYTNPVDRTFVIDKKFTVS